MTTQKQLTILIIVTVSLTSFLAGYLLTRPDQQTNDIIQQQRGNLIDRFSEVTSKSTPTPLPPGLLQATDNSVLAPTNAPNDNAVLYYHPSNGYVSKIDLETRANTSISTTQLVGLTDVMWSPDKNRVITISRSSNGPVYKYYDYISRRNGLLGGGNIKNAVFSPNSQQVALVRSAGEESVIEVFNFEDLSTKTNQSPRTILKTRLTNMRLFWPTENILSFIADDFDSGTQSLYTISKDGDLTELIGGEYRLSVLWSPDGSKLLYSSSQESKEILRLLDVKSKQSRIMPIKTTAKNCAWTINQNSTICIAEFQGETIASQISIINLEEKILFSNLIISPQEVFLSHLDNFLVIISTTDQSIWGLKLAN